MARLPSRQARPAPTHVNFVKTFLQSFIMWGAFLVIGPLLVLRIEDKISPAASKFAFPFQIQIAIALFVSSWLVAWSSAYFLVSRGDGTPLPIDATNRLVVSGPYRYIRNPMAFSSLLQGGAIGLYFGSPLLLLYIFTGCLMWNFLARPWEEFDLEKKFGADYVKYKNDVRCWAPRLRPYSPDSHVTAP